ncbi:MAG: hypothetical protein PHG51_07720 [Candidatus Omnitrophica bacterium]|nr:hypothetical protein [Candidatus Omnitrophota bacterium]
MTAPFGAGVNTIQGYLQRTIGGIFFLDDGTADIDSAPVGTILSEIMVPTDPILVDIVGYTITWLPLLPPGTISLTTSAATGGLGELGWVIYYIPYDPGASIMPI